MYGLILCAGKGTRMKPLSDIISKPLLPFQGKPILLHQIEALQEVGIDSIGIVVNRHNEAEFIKFFMIHSMEDEVEIFIQEELTGILTAIKSAIRVHNKDVIAMAGDTIFSTKQLNKVLNVGSSDLVLATRKVPRQELTRRSNIIWDKNSGKIINTIEKPTKEEINGEWAGAPLWRIGVACWEFMDKVERSNHGEYAIEGLVDALLESDMNVKGVDIGDTIDLTFPKDVLVNNFPYIDKMLS